MTQQRGLLPTPALLSPIPEQEVGQLIVQGGLEGTLQGQGTPFLAGAALAAGLPCTGRVLRPVCMSGESDSVVPPVSSPEASAPAFCLSGRLLPAHMTAA